MTEPYEAAFLKGTIFESPRRGGKSLVMENLRQAARIKALEDDVTALAVDLSQLIYVVECDGHNGDHQGCAVCEDIANIRNRLKEADQ